MEFLETFTLILDSALRLSVPLLLACLAGLYSERSGIFDIGLEGKMLGAAFAAGAVAYITSSAWLGLLAAIAVSVGLALVHGYASIAQRGNQIVSGVAINFVAAGLTALLGQAWFSMGGKTPQLPNEARFRPIELPFAESLRDVPIIGQFYSELLSGHSLLVYAAIAAVPLTWWILYRTRFGLRLRAVGENPGAVDTAGISVIALRYQAVMITGVLCGIAGSYLSIAQSAGFSKDMTAGKGFIALAALIFAKWKPINALGACFLFGFLDAVAIRAQGTVLPVIGEVPVQFMQALPYILTVVLLAGFIGKAIPPKAGGVAYTKER
ncbi:ABC transporter permease [Cohaesibacter gelatinilyticus]|uniref:Nucleoside ABC transporter membrane protein n=1 Tax=Cohaesibacter gelatinilyticus TaxID=372072 RepID=A0A285PHE0_9HYPH|nr:ABC transporter permease [Cohaesibacter gelatinilyticus]SNZ20693.1 nucleoside ABC transporter membrane protein [Cohaesibacter gelatinilyticus]